MTVFLPLSPSLSTAQADPSSTPTSGAVDETSADAVAVADFDPRTHPGIKDSLEQLAWVLDTRAHRWHGTGRDADRAWALELRNGELRELRSIYSAATRHRSDASGRWKADAAIQKVQARMTDLHLLFGHPPPSRPPP